MRRVVCAHVGWEKFSARVNKRSAVCVAPDTKPCVYSLVRIRFHPYTELGLSPDWLTVTSFDWLNFSTATDVMLLKVAAAKWYRARQHR